VSTTPERAPQGSIHEVREAARRQARALPIGLFVVSAIGLAVLTIAIFVLLDYRFNQDPHRIVKLLAGLSGIAAILIRPMVGLTLLPVATPFLGWMPRIPIPGVNVLNFLLIAVFGVWAIGRVMRHQDLFRRGRLSGTIAVLLGIAALSVVRGGAFPTGYTYHVGEAIYNLIRSSMTFAVYFIGLAMVRGPKARQRLSWAIVLGLLAEAVCTIIYGRNGKGQRALGSFGQSNELGAFLAMFTAFTLAMVAGTRNWLARGLLVATALAGTLGVMLSVSRGALVALGVAGIYAGLRTSRLLTFLLLVAMLSAPLWLPDYVMQRLTTTTVGTEDDSHLEGSAQARIDTWHAIVTLVTDHPLDGVGFSGLGDVLPETGEQLGLEVKDSAHNTYLRFLGEMGLLGLGVFIVLLVKCFRLSAAGIRAARTRFDRQLAVGFGAATLAMAISCLFGDRFFSILITGNFWMLGALVNDALIERQETGA
jgi:hypothetical protein